MSVSCRRCGAARTDEYISIRRHRLVDPEMTDGPGMSRDDCCRAFAEGYEVSGLAAMREVERRVLGCDYGGTSWTTRRQADEIARRLDLRPGALLLEVGAGSGWPGLYLARACGCAAVLVDLPLNALEQAGERASRDGLGDRVARVAASGPALPFSDGSFDAVSHSDVLCCLPEKLETLHECRRLVAEGAPMLFSVIALAPGLTGSDRVAAVEAGPPFVESDGEYSDLLAKAGWRLVERFDVTADHRRSLVALAEGLAASDELSEILGREVVRDARKRRLEQIEAIDAEWLVREMYDCEAA